MSDKISKNEVLKKRIKKLEEEITWLMTNPAREWHYVEAWSSELDKYKARQTVARENKESREAIDRKYQEIAEIKALLKERKRPE